MHLTALVAPKFWLVILLLFISCAGASSQWPAEFDVLTASNAKQVERHDMSQHNMRQLNYTVELAYPAMAVNKKQYQKLQELGWTACTDSRTSWDNFPDISEPHDKRCVFNYGKSFVKDKMLLDVSQHYYSKLVKGEQCPKAPDNTSQWVFIVIYTFDSEKDLATHLSETRRTCGRR